MESQNTTFYRPTTKQTFNQNISFIDSVTQSRLPKSISMMRKDFKIRKMSVKKTKKNPRVESCGENILKANLLAGLKAIRDNTKSHNFLRNTILNSTNSKKKETISDDFFF